MTFALACIVAIETPKPSAISVDCRRCLIQSLQKAEVLPILQ
jgi:hypothetical protein